MKKYFFVCSLIILITASLGWSGCKKKDTTAPAIYLNGSDPVTISLGSTYTDAGASATDDVDGTITDKIVTKGLPINTNLVGTYTIYYDVSDAAGNAAFEITRTVYVINDAANFGGKYNESTYCTSTLSAPDTITASSSINNRVTISNFGLNMAASIYADILSNNITITAQTVGSHVYWGSGTVTNNSSVLVISYSDSLISGSTTTCTSTYTKQ